jgi:hypothetical protein
LIEITDPCDYPNDDVTFTAEFEVDLTAKERHDIGIYFATDGDGNGDGALTGGCSITSLPWAPDPPWLDLDGTNDPYPGTKKPSGVQDDCGDIDAEHDPLFVTLTITTKCIDPDGNGYLNLPYCTSWRQPGANELCLGPLDAFPGSPSKCKCEGGFEIDIPVPQVGTIKVDKVLDPSTDPGEFNLWIDDDIKEACASDGETTGAVQVDAGTDVKPGVTHTVSETACAGTNPDYYDTEIYCVDQEGDEKETTGPGPLDVFVEPNDNWGCTITNTRQTGSVVVEKVDDDEPPKLVGGAGFSPSPADGGGFTEISTGRFCADGFYVGVAYTISESTVPPGYDGDDPKTFTPMIPDTCADRSGDPADLTFENIRHRGAIRVTKTRKHAADGPGDRFHEGVSFKVNCGGEEEASGATDSNGEVCFDGLLLNQFADCGNYTVTEVKPDGYAVDPESASVTVDNKASCADTTFVGEELSFKNTPLTDLTVTVDSQVPGGTFSTIECKLADNVVGQAGPGDDISKTMENLKPGTYICTIEIDP